MNCEKPFYLGSLPCPCQKCLPCLKARQRIWMHRLLLEEKLHAHNAFVTLTYDDDHLPSGGTLQHRDVQLWLKRLRKALGSQKVRYYLAGEYGENTARPHYHVVLFGVSAEAIAGPECVVSRGHVVFVDKNSCLSRTWGNGFVSAGDLTAESAQYVTKYVTKRVENNGSDQPQEYSRMSLRPAIGFGAVEKVSDVAQRHGYMEREGNVDVPNTLRYGRKLLPLGRYLRGKLRQKMGVTQDGSAPVESLRQYVQEVLPGVRRDEEALAKAQKVHPVTFRKELREQRVRNLTARHRIYTNRGNL